MKLHVIDISPNSRITEATVHHLNLDVEIIRKDIFSGELDRPEFLAINPNGKVPVLEDGDFKLWESRAITQYLASKNNQKDFFPMDETSRSDILRWQFWEALHFNKAVATVTWETVAKPAMNLGEADEGIIEAGLKEFHQFAPVLEKHLEGKVFIMGEKVSLADFSVGSHSALIQSDHSRIPLVQYPNISAWIQRLDTVPAWKKTAPPFEL